MRPRTSTYRPAKSERFLRPAFGLAAAFAALATMGLTVVAPAAYAPAEATVQQVRVDSGATSRTRVPAEVAIMPARIDVVAVRTRAAVRAAQLAPADGRQRS